MGESRQAVNNWVRNGYSVGNGVLYRILEKFDQVSNSWLLKGEGNMLKSGSIISSEKNLIPFYDDVASIGGTNELIADTKGASIPSEYIDTGDWFRNATAAIRHYGDSMIEYPPGCILALKEVKERQLIIWGKDYVVETNEYRITKCVQRGFDKEHITAYSSNTETYPDGRLKHEPTDIAWKDISRIFLVLGYVVKKNGGTIVFSNQKQN
ncbi:MAG: hypothetical protein LBG15_09400 [Dysgonamonadaceae bacterium]|nr:hypothetical protein [Dysgonamonadaceae bacterium]